MSEVDLEFSDFLGKFNDLGKSEWITVYESYRENNNSRTFYCAMVANQRVKKSLGFASWDLHIGGKNQPVIMSWHLRLYLLK